MLTVEKCLQYCDEFLVFTEGLTLEVVANAWCIPFTLAAASGDLWINDYCAISIGREKPRCEHSRRKVARREH